MEKKVDILFEASWEVCNKVGGIYTVVKSKVGPTKNHYGENYYLIGPYIPQAAQGEFEQKVAPTFIENAFNKLRERGIICHYGRWLTSGTPQTILIDTHAFVDQKDSIKKELWENFKIDSLFTDFWDFDTPVVWAYAIGMFLEEVKKGMPDKRIVVQCHEWLAGTTLLYIKSRNIQIGTVFTTHATMLGRTLASQDMNIYSLLDQIKPEEEARKNGIIAKFHMERECARNATVFTTVSEITGLEAEKLLGRKPDVILPNGLDIDKFAAFDDLMIKHRFFKQKVREFCSYYFFPYYHIDISKIQVFFTCARYEFHTKGLDILIRALGMLNDRMKKEKSDKIIVTFFWIPGNNRGIRNSIIENRTKYEDVKETIEEHFSDMKNRLLDVIISNKAFSKEALFDEETLLTMSKKVKKMSSQGSVPTSTHYMFNEEQDPIINGFKYAGLNNTAEDKVKVIFYPTYLTGADRLLDLGYYEAMLAGNLGIFPSYYEPWGYTPFEAAALGVPSITTDLAGFGRFIAPKVDGKYPGIVVINRLNKDEGVITNELVEEMYKFVMMPRADRIQNRISARELSELADWKKLISCYLEAHQKAIAPFP